MWFEFIVKSLGIYEEGFGYCAFLKFKLYGMWRKKNIVGSFRYVVSIVS